MHYIFRGYQYTQEDLENRIMGMLAIPFPGPVDRATMTDLLGMLDLTTLEGADTKDKVVQLCRQARFSDLNKVLPDAAAVCVYPSLVRYAKRELRGTGVRVASVAGGFPSGQTSLHVKLEEVRFALGEGAEEIDTVISRGKLLDGFESEVYDELSAIRETCGGVHLKVILETGELSSVAFVRQASELAILAGADFIKTSTGKISVGATPWAFLVMLDTIREYLEKSGRSVGIKAAGGIRTPDQAMVYSRLLLSVLGEQWFNRDYFRIGASSLAGEILKGLGYAD
jgi:deoxyribose-phosphate aldolase